MLIPLLHSILIVGIWLAPFFVEWKIFLALIILYYLQLFIVGNCILTIWQLGERKRDATFYWWALEKFGFHLDKTKVRIFVDTILPWILLAIALTWQVGLGNAVLLTF